MLRDHLSVVSLHKIGEVPGPDGLSCPRCWPACLWVPDRVLASIFEDCFLHPGPHDSLATGHKLYNAIPILPTLFANGTVAPGKCVPSDRYK